jgi:N-acetylglucosaminyldiphosphoundecaprenol N-acetyl-beta-D-mannosaminyltransferase
MVVPDGTPLVWIGRWRGYGRRIGRVAGADLVDAVCAASVSGGLTHYFYGGKPGVAAEMARRLSERHPGLLVAGVFSPPMREIGPDLCITDDMRAELDAIRRSGADFIWIGLSSPKQDYLAIQAAPLVGRGVFFAVGAAFDFHSGAVRRAPGWMRNNGLEWLHRLWSEPRRLWRRYLVLVPQFVWDLAVAGVVSGPRAAGHR